MRRGKRVVHEGAAKGRQRCGKGAVILFLARVKAGVLHQGHLPRLQRGHDALGRTADAVVGKDDRLAKRGLQRGDDLAQAHAVDALALGAVEMRQQNGNAALGLDVLDRRHDLVDAGGVGDLAVFDRDVHVDAGQHDLSVKIHVVDGVELCHVASFRVQELANLSRMAGAASTAPGGCAPPCRSDPITVSRVAPGSDSP